MLKLLSQNVKVCFILSTPFLTKNKGVMAHSLKVEKKVLRIKITCHCNARRSATFPHTSSFRPPAMAILNALMKSFQTVLVWVQLARDNWESRDLDFGVF